jgi:SAM-dependent methyltransferase
MQSGGKRRSIRAKHLLQYARHMSYPSAMADGPPRIFDSDAVTLHRARARKIAGERFLVRQAGEGLALRLDAERRTFSEALELNASEATAGLLGPHAKHWTRQTLSDDESLRGEPQQFDLVVSLLSLHAVNDLPGVLFQIRRILKPDGLFVAALFSGETLRELRESLAAGELETLGGISPRVAPFADVRALGGLLQRAGFALPVADIERTVVRYRQFETLVSDLRMMGETNALHERSRKPLRRRTLAAALSHYASHHADPDGRLRATFEIAYLTAWAPHESQQQPLKPGSAMARLADALNTSEQSAGEAVPKR